MEIEVKLSSVTEVEYQFNEWEVKRALVELVEREHSEKILDKGEWLFEWWDETEPSGNLRLVVSLVQKKSSEGGT